MIASLLRKLRGHRPKPAAPEMVEPDLTFARAAEELAIKTRFAQDSWGLGDGGRWDADLDAGILTFSTPKGWTITAPLQVVGTFNTADGSWLWGWDHPSVSEPLGRHAALVRAFGATHGLERLTERHVAATEEDAWTFTALACHLAGAQGGYRGPSATSRVFMTYGAVTIVASPAS